MCWPDYKLRHYPREFMWLLSKMHSSLRGVSGSLLVRSASLFYLFLLCPSFLFLLPFSLSSLLLSSPIALSTTFTKLSVLSIFYTRYAYKHKQHAHFTLALIRASLSFTFSTSISLHLQNARDSFCFLSTFTAPSVSSILFLHHDGAALFEAGHKRLTNLGTISRLSST